MKALGKNSSPDSARIRALAGLGSVDQPVLPGLATGWRAGQRGNTNVAEPFDRVARLAGLVLDVPLAAVTIATVRPTPAGATVQISSAGHPLALVRRADGTVHAFGRPGTLLGLLPDPDLHDARLLMRVGDSLILYTDGVIEARSHVGRDLYGDSRLRDVVAGLDGRSAAQAANAIRKAVREFSGGVVRHDTVVLVLKILPPGSG